MTKEELTDYDAAAAAAKQVTVQRHRRHEDWWLSWEAIVTSASGAVTTPCGQLEDFEVEVNDGEVVLDIIHRLQATQAPDLAGALELQGRQVRLVLDGDQWHAEARLHDTACPPSRRPRPLRSRRCVRSVIRDLVTDVSFKLPEGA